MNANILHIENRGGDSAIKQALTPEEMDEFEVLSKDPSVISITLFGPDGEAILNQDIEDMASVVYANVFDMAERMGTELGQSAHRSITFESGDLEINCFRWSQSCLVLYRIKGNRKFGG